MSLVYLAAREAFGVGKEDIWRQRSERIRRSIGGKGIARREGSPGVCDVWTHRPGWLALWNCRQVWERAED